MLDFNLSTKEIELIKRITDEEVNFSGRLITPATHWGDIYDKLFDYKFINGCSNKEEKTLDKVMNRIIEKNVMYEGEYRDPNANPNKIINIIMINN